MAVSLLVAGVVWANDPYVFNGKSTSGDTAGQEGYFWPLYINARDISDAVGRHEHTFEGMRDKMYMPNGDSANMAATEDTSTLPLYTLAHQKELHSHH